ncbi:hypothetical protein AVEN_11760-1 [Araneus ventricosus]|uniref:Uncharacterized protein n=1 Tax=Araneus ventricosus TaxID=182803 RepID=A0A4Y2HY54_ARAVE|nr:hypothetical protein AVEN_11760-1 [Araneus ventricosus]
MRCLNKIKFNQGATSVVLYGYPKDLPEKSAKTTERFRRDKRHTAPDMVFRRLIAMLSVKLESEGFLVKQVTEDADHLVVTSAVVAAEEH